MPNILDGLAVLLPIKQKCQICGKAPHPDRTTTEKKEDKGCLKSIPKNLGCSAIAVNPALPNYATAAHHLIPANQCLKKFRRLSKMCKTVGYDVNNKENGIALPTCGQQSMNSYTDKKLKYGKLSDEDKQNVAFIIMEGLNKQWHVGHHNWKIDLKTDSERHPENYDKLVKTKLRDIEKDIAANGNSICNPKSGESGKKVITKLNNLSKRIRKKVESWDKYFVSAKAYEYAKKYEK